MGPARTGLTLLLKGVRLLARDPGGERVRSPGLLPGSGRSGLKERIDAYKRVGLVGSQDDLTEEERSRA